LGLARAVGHLHDHGIVHRDLKPGNVFLENGTVKVGDYGLSKSIGSSQRTAQTMSVGTVHYMAPEISTGNYNKQIDTYAAGIILYEMLTGHVPFEGESAGEILMKHLTAPPDLSRLPAEYVPVVAKALAKNPVQRHAGMAEMVRAVELAEGGQAPTPPRPVAVPVVSPARQPSADPSRSRSPEPVLAAVPAESTGSRAAELSGSMVLSVLFAGLGAILWTALSRGSHVPDAGQKIDLYNLFFLTVASTWAVLVPAKLWGSKRGSTWGRRVVMLVLGAAVGLQAYWLQGGRLNVSHGFDLADAASLTQQNIAASLSYFALAFFAVRWWRMTDRRRSARFSFFPLLAAAFWGLLLGVVVPPTEHAWGINVLVLVLTSAVVQMVSPWEQPPPPVAKRMRLRCA
jgi:hypothetical protein